MSSGQDVSFGEKLRQLREAAGLTQEELAERAGLTPKGIGALERGDRKRPYPNTVRALADALGLTGRSALPSSVRSPDAIRLQDINLPLPLIYLFPRLLHRW